MLESEEGERMTGCRNAAKMAEPCLTATPADRRQAYPFIDVARVTNDQ